MFTRMLAVKTPGCLAAHALRAISTIRRQLRRYNSRDNACSVILLASHRFWVPSLTDDAMQKTVFIGGVQDRYRPHAVRKHFFIY